VPGEYTAHVDTFAHDALPPQELWPEFRFDLTELQYPEHINCGRELMQDNVRRKQEERLFREAVRDFAVSEVAPRVSRMDDAQAIDSDLVEKLFELGLMGVEIPERFGFKELYPEGREWVNQGNSCIIDPMGKVLAGPAKGTQDILYADLDLDLIPAAKRMFDAAGHYARPDVFRFEVAR